MVQQLLRKLSENKMEKFEYQIITQKSANGIRSKMTCDGTPIRVKLYEELYEEIFVPISETHKRALKSSSRLEKMTTNFSSYIDLRVMNVTITT